MEDLENCSSVASYFNLFEFQIIIMDNTNVSLIDFVKNAEMERIDFQMKIETVSAMTNIMHILS